MESLLRILESKDADDELLKLVETWAIKMGQFVDMLAWGLAIITAIAVVTITIVFHLSNELKKVKTQLNTAQRDLAASPKSK